MGKLDHQISMSLDRLQTMLRYEVVVPNLWEANPHFEGAGDSRDERTSSWSFVVTNQHMAMIVQFAVTSLVLHLMRPYSKRPIMLGDDKTKWHVPM